MNKIQILLVFLSFVLFSSQFDLFENWSDEEKSAFLNAKVEVPPEATLVNPDIEHKRLRWGIPEFFNYSALVEKKGCPSPIKYQGNCGSCWAFCSLGSLSTKLCMKNPELYNIVLSTQQLLSCNGEGYNCERGGVSAFGFIYAAYEGVVLEQCYPYKSGEVGKTLKCQYTEDVCPASTEDNEIPFSKYYAKKGSAKIARVDGRPSARFVESMKKEIYDHGPITSTFKVYQDFMDMKKFDANLKKNGGIYTPDSPNTKNNRYLGNHCVQVVGWGSENVNGEKVDYWIAANSWSVQWGDMGYFKIRIGESNFEMFFAYGEPDPDRSMLLTQF